MAHPFNKQTAIHNQHCVVPGDKIQFIEKKLILNGMPTEEPYASSPGRTWIPTPPTSRPVSPSYVYPRGMLRDNVKDGARSYLLPLR